MGCEPSPELSVEEEQTLISAVQNNHSIPKHLSDRFIRQHEARIAYWARKLSLDGIHKEDLIAVGNLAAWEALTTFAVEKGHSLSKHVQSAVRWAMQKHRRQEFRHLNRCTSLSSSAPDSNEMLWASVEPYEHSNLDLGDTSRHSDPSWMSELALTVPQIVDVAKTLSPREQEVVRHVFSKNRRPVDAAQKMSISRARTSQLLKSSIGKFRVALGENLVA